MKYESCAKKLEILMFEYQKTGNVSLTQNPVGCREYNNLLRRSDTTDMNEEMVVVRKTCFFNWSEKLRAMPRGLQIVALLWLHLSFSDIVSRRLYDQTIIENSDEETQRVDW